MKASNLESSEGVSNKVSYGHSVPEGLSLPSGQALRLSSSFVLTVLSALLLHSVPFVIILTPPPLPPHVRTKVALATAHGTAGFDYVWFSVIFTRSGF